MNSIKPTKLNVVVSVVIKLFLLLAIALAVYALLRQFDMIVMPAIIKWQYGVVLLILQVFIVYLAAMSWKLLLISTTEIKLSIAEAASHVGLVLVGKYIPGKVWGSLLKVWVLQKRDKNVPSLVGVVCLEQIVGIHSAFIIGGIVYFKPMHELFVLYIAAAVLSILFFRQFLQIGLKLTAHMLKRLKDNLYQAQEISNNLSLNKLLIIYVCNIVHWAVTGAVIAVMAQTVGMDLTGQQFINIACASVLSILVGFLAFFSPGGIGVREVAFVSIVGASIGYDLSVTLSMLYRVWLIIIDSLWGIFSYLYCRSNDDL